MPQKRTIQQWSDETRTAIQEEFAIKSGKRTVLDWAVENGVPCAETEITRLRHENARLLNQRAALDIERQTQAHRIDELEAALREVSEATLRLLKNRHEDIEPFGVYAQLGRIAADALEG